jgi:hypothetical protein
MLVFLELGNNLLLLLLLAQQRMALHCSRILQNIACHFNARIIANFFSMVGALVTEKEHKAPPKFHWDFKVRECVDNTNQSIWVKGVIANFNATMNSTLIWILIRLLVRLSPNQMS